MAAAAAACRARRRRALSNWAGDGGAVTGCCGLALGLLLIPVATRVIAPALGGRDRRGKNGAAH
ncbi:MAG: hypothetical protein U5N10_00180 [Gemmobacter sp.]|nr:hypothetical protein [Gemmobacter sp.]